MLFQADRSVIPARMLVRNDSIFFHNGEEYIPSKVIQLDSDSLHILLPAYQSVLKITISNNAELQGSWSPPGKPDSLTMLFSGRWHSDKNEKILPLDRQSYQVTFSAKTENQYPAIGLFTRSQGQAYGTFLTETGDYRFLEGERNGDSLWLSCFDGIHLFLFNAQFSNTDSLISGTFHSGKNWFEPWVGTLNNEPQLNHPDSITRFMAKEGTLLEFEVMDRQGIRRFFNAEDWIGKVSIIQVMGSWCPNCLDESRYLQELITKLDSKEVQLIPVAFERKGNVAEQVNAIEHFENLLGSGPITYIGGLASKTEASSVFNQLNNISSFPTTIFLDKKGVLRKIHTGFYGPGTGKYYERYKTSTEHFVRQLLSETEEKTW